MKVLPILLSLMSILSMACSLSEEESFTEKETGRLGFILDNNSRRVFVFDLDGRRLLRTVDLRQYGYVVSDMVLGENRIYGVARGDSRSPEHSGGTAFIFGLGLKTGGLEYELELEGFFLRRLCKPPDSTVLYVMGQTERDDLNDYLLGVDLDRREVVLSMRLDFPQQGKIPQDVVVSPTGKQAIMALLVNPPGQGSSLQQPQEVALIDLSEEEVEDVAVLDVLLGMPVYSPEGDGFFVSSYSTNTTYHVDLRRLVPEVVTEAQTDAAGPTLLLKSPHAGVVAYNINADSTTTLKRLSSDGRVASEVTLPVPIGYATSCGERLLCARNHHAVYQQLRAQPEAAEGTYPEEFYIIDTGTWEIVERFEIPLPADAFNKALFWVSPAETALN